MLTPLVDRPRLGRQSHPHFSKIAWHSHNDGYAALVLSGGYSEAGDEGRHWVEAGDVLLHHQFDGHQNSFGARSSEILNLPLPLACGRYPKGRILDPDLLVKTAEWDIAEASLLLAEQLTPVAEIEVADWPDELARSLRDDQSTEIGAWAECHGLTPSAASRGFKLALGMSPTSYRKRQRARRAFQTLADQTLPLAELAAAHGFSDQSHMTHAIVALTGTTPGTWRKLMSNTYKKKMSSTG